MTLQAMVCTARLPADYDSDEPFQILVVTEAARDANVRIAVFRFQRGKHFTISPKFCFVVASRMCQPSRTQPPLPAFEVFVVAAEESHDLLASVHFAKF